MNDPIPSGRLQGEWRIWTGVQLALATALTAAFSYALIILFKSSASLPLAGWHRPLAWLLVVGGMVVFGVRSVQLSLRIMGPRTRP